MFGFGTFCRLRSHSSGQRLELPSTCLEIELSVSPLRTTIEVASAVRMTLGCGSARTGLSWTIAVQNDLSLGAEGRSGLARLTMESTPTESTTAAVVAIAVPSVILW